MVVVVCAQAGTQTRAVGMQNIAAVAGNILDVARDVSAVPYARTHRRFELVNGHGGVESRAGGSLSTQYTVYAARRWCWLLAVKWQPCCRARDARPHALGTYPTKPQSDERAKGGGGGYLVYAAHVLGLARE